MILIWSTSEKLGSKLIRWGLEEEASHFCVAFSLCGEHELILEQKFGGFEVTWLSKWKRKNRVIEALTPIADDVYDDHDLMGQILTRFSGTDYDMAALWYFSWRVALKKVFNEPFPKRNRWQSRQDPLCVGIAETIYKERPKWFRHKPREFDITSPMGLYRMFNKSLFREVKFGSS